MLWPSSQNNLTRTSLEGKFEKTPLMKKNIKKK